MNNTVIERGPGMTRLGTRQLSLAIVALGVLLILTSLLPWGGLVKGALWTEEDSAAYDRTSQEYHRISYQSPQRAGLTQQQLTAQRERTKSRFEALRAKLQYARQQPLTWSRRMLWTGALLTTCGCLGRLAGQKRPQG